MSKRVQRFACGECGETHVSNEDADSCERHHADDREREAQEKAWHTFDDEYSWRLTVDQIRELTTLAESWFGRSVKP